MIEPTVMQKNVMKQMTQVLFGLMFLLFVSCQDTLTIDPQDDFIVFGHFDGYCFGEACVDFYKLSSDGLFESYIDQFSGNGFYPHDDYYALSQDKFNLVEDLGEFVPPELWLETATHIGQADVSDVGSIYFEIKNGSDHRYWVFENGDFEMSEVYSVFMSKIEEKTSLLKF